MNICRPVLTEYYDKKKILVDYLFWFDETLMNDIDEKIKFNKQTDEDFTYSIKTQFVRNLICMNCKTEYMGGLVVPPDLLYPPNFDLGERKRKLFIEGGGRVKCPNCGGNFTLLVAYLFE